MRIRSNSLHVGANRQALYLVSALLLPLSGEAFAEPHHHHIHGANIREAAYSSYRAPAVTLTDMNGELVQLDRFLSENRPTLVEFFFTSCTTICPVMASTLSSARREMASLRDDFRILSISIDPEHDTPARLRDYAQNFDQDSRWRLLTGGRRDIDRVLDAFDARYAGADKMNHQPYVFLRAGPDRPWLRIEGVISGQQLVAAYAKVLDEADPQSKPK